jgi:class I lanthipeptide synthase
VGPPNPSHGVGRGTAGEAILATYRRLAGIDLSDAHRSGLLARIAAELNAGLEGPGLYSGLAGAVWTLVHCSQGAVDEGDLITIDESIAQHVGSSAWSGHFDLINGLTGLAVYATERLPSASAHALLDAIVDRLAAMSSEDVDGVYWWTPPELLPDHQRQEHPKGHVDLGVAHGVPGVLWALAAAARAGNATARQLLDRAVPWLLVQQDGDEQARFGYTTTLDGTSTEPARLAWCYGDLGIATTLAAVGQMAGRSDWVGEATRLGRLAAARDEATTGVVDAGVCHGAAGVGHLFRRLFDATGDAVLGDASARWLGVAQGMPPPDHTGFLEGPIGVELSLLARDCDVDPAWDRLLLASPVPGMS